MKTYTGIFEYNNGYTCSCCRQTWLGTESYEFEDDDVFDDILGRFRQFEDDETSLLCLTQNGDGNSYNRNE